MLQREEINQSHANGKRCNIKHRKLSRRSPMTHTVHDDVILIMIEDIFYELMNENIPMYVPNIQPVGLYKHASTLSSHYLDDIF